MDQSFIFKTDRPWPNPRLKQGIIIGHTTHNSAKIWVRAGNLGAFTLLVYPMNMPKLAEFQQSLLDVPFNMTQLPKQVLVRQAFVENYDQDTTLVFHINELSPFCSYGVALYGCDSGSTQRIVIGQDIGSDTWAYSFRTQSDARFKTISFGFYSCHMPYSQSLFKRLQVENMEMWDSFASTLARHRERDQLAFLIGGGDQVYVDGIDSLSIWAYLNKCLADNPNVIPDKDTMLNWYRDIYRGYWGFPQLREVFSRCPTYMIWDDHELGDGWGSYFFKEGSKKDEMDEILPEWKSLGLSYQTCVHLVRQMGECAKQVYYEYQHSHNPDTPLGQFDYGFNVNGTAVYMLDGRSQRDVNQPNNRILGQTQIQRFSDWLDTLTPDTTPFVFVVSAVPLMHLSSTIVNSNNFAMDVSNLEDDLRDAWEHKLHDKERKKLVNLLFKAAERGLKISILSGDVHISAAFRMTNSSGKTIYQLTSSAITYNTSRAMGWALGAGVEDRGDSPDGYRYKRLALYTERNYAMVVVDPVNGCADFQLYGPQALNEPNGNASKPLTHSMVKIELVF